MANVVRFAAKSARDWSWTELSRYRINITSIEPQRFFRQANPSLKHINPELFTTNLGTTDVSDDAYHFLSHLGFANWPHRDPASSSDFSRELLIIAGFRERGLLLRSHHTIPLSICGEDKRARPDVCLTNRQSMILLVLKGDKTKFDLSNIEEQVIGEAIAAFQYNSQRRQCMRLPKLETMTIPCITMTGTRPTFYLVPVTEELSDAVMDGRRPEVETNVLMCPTGRPNHTMIEGMEVPEYRRLAFQRMIAFKSLAKIHWKKFVSVKRNIEPPCTPPL